MATDLYEVELSDHARIPYLSLGPEDRRLVDGYRLDLRNWGNDQHLRSRARRFDSRDDETYAIRTSNNQFILVFKVFGKTIEILSIFNENVLKAFGAGHGAS